MAAPGAPRLDERKSSIAPAADPQQTRIRSVRERLKPLYPAGADLEVRSADGASATSAA